MRSFKTAARLEAESIRTTIKPSLFELGLIIKGLESVAYTDPETADTVEKMVTEMRVTMSSYGLKVK